MNPGYALRVAGYVIRDACYALRVAWFGVRDPMPDPQSFCFAQLVTRNSQPVNMFSNYLNLCSASA